MATIPRIVYFAQTVTITTNGGTPYILPISSANIEVTRPIEAVSTFGKFSSLNTAQTNLTTCKSTIKGYLGQAGGGLNSFDAGVINALINDTKASNQITITCGSSNGFSMKGILTNIGIDISMGAFGMIDLGFAGVGAPFLYAPTSATSEVNASYSIQPITTMSIGQDGAMTNTYASSIKFSYDLPTDTLSALGDNPNAPQASLTSQIATKAPYKTTVSVEGHGVDPTKLDTAIANLAYKIGNISVTLPNAKVNARSFNNAAGQVSASFAYTVEDTTATIASVSINAYVADASAQSLPAYGA